MVYREGEDRLGAEERESEAVRQLGRWRDRVRTRILVIAAVIGIGLFVAGIYGVTELQLRLNGGVGSVRISILFGSAFFVLAMVVGRWIGRIAVRRGMGVKVDELAKAYEIPRELLAATADLLRAL